MRLMTILSETVERWLFVICLLILVTIPFVIHTYGFVPPDDANRHVAKAISGKPWPEILVMKPTYAHQDHNEGWHAALTGLYRMGVSKDGLLLFSSIGIFILLMGTGLVLYRKHPLAWMSVVGLAVFIMPVIRWLLGRPYMISGTVWMILLVLWRPGAILKTKHIIFSSLLIAAAGWMHGAWYLFALFPLSVLLTLDLHKTWKAAVAWGTGSLLAGFITGNPIHYLFFQILQSLESTENTPVNRLLVGEFQPRFHFLPLIIFLSAALWLLIQKQKKDSVLIHPAFWGAVLGWVLGLMNGRFWYDWGSVATMVWVAEVFSSTSLPRVPIRLSLIGLLGIFLAYTADMNSRWSNQQFADPLSLEDPEHQGWLPDPGGIFYNDTMSLFYKTFYENPHGDWRYILGFEPVLMPEDDLQTYRDIQFYRRQDDMLYQPWVDKMKPEDRLVLRKPKATKPDIPELEWKYVAYRTWSGRLPREASNPVDMNSTDDNQSGPEE